MARNRITDWQHIHLEGGILSWDILELIAKEKAIATEPAAYGLPRTISVMQAAGPAYSRARALYQDYQERVRGAVSQAERNITREYVLRIMSCLGWSFSTVQKLDGGSFSYPIRRIAYGRIPLLTVAGSNSFDKADRLYAITSSQSAISPFNMLQQYLSSSGEARWGILANGEKLRLMRSATALSRPEYLEFDLEAILAGDFYNEFMLLYRILHVSRVRNDVDDTDLEIWEEWRNTSITDGERVRDRLRDGVKAALVALGDGFIHANAGLKDELRNGRLGAQEYYHELLRLCYRLLFLSVLEERYSPDGMRLVFDPASTPSARETYEKGYSLSRLRHIMRSTKYRTGNHHDLWEAMVIVFRSLEDGETKLGHPALGGIFSSLSCPHLDGLQLLNRDFLSAMESLRWSTNDDGLYWIDYRNLGSIELGSVYESLLELVPVVDQGSLKFRFLDGSDEETNAGNKRKTSGSYYTPDFLVDQLISTALMPVVEERLKDTSYASAEEALLSLTVVDPACGSGHFLIAAASAIATRLALIRDSAGNVEGFRSAFRDVISRCIYGVDINPMAVELTKMSLWIEGYEPGKPLSFLDAHIKCGNSIVGVFDTSVLTEKGIPKDAFKAFEDDDKAVIKLLASKNASELKELRKSVTAAVKGTGDVFSKDQLSSQSAITILPEDSIDEIRRKSELYRKYMEELKSSPENRACDAYMAAFYAPKTSIEDGVPTTAMIGRILDDNLWEEDLPVLSRVEAMAERDAYFHWPLEFPEIFKEGGFDVVLGNPPWDKQAFKEEEFFASRDVKISKAQNATQRKRMIAALEHSESEYERNLYKEYIIAFRTSLAQSQFLHVSREDGGAYPLSGFGIVNLYAIFTELASKLRKSTGAVGFVVPTGICTDDGTKELFGHFVEEKIVSSVYDFANSSSVEVTTANGKKKTVQNFIFPAVDGRMRFSLLTLCCVEEPDFCFFLHSVKDLDDKRRHFPLSSEDIMLMNPNTRTLPLIRSQNDYELLKKIYRNSVVVLDEGRADGNVFNLSLMTMFNMSSDSNLFLSGPAPGRMPLYEGKFISQYDHRFNSYEGETDSNGNPRETLCSSIVKSNPDYEITPQYWIDEKEIYLRYSNASKDIKDYYRKGIRKVSEGPSQAEDQMQFDFADYQLGLDFSNDDSVEKTVKNLTPDWCFGFRSVARATDTRTCIATLFPLSGVGHKIILITEIDLDKTIILNANLSSLVFDFVARRKIGNTDMCNFHFKQLPVIPPSSYTDEERAFVIETSKKLLGTTRKMAEILSCPVTIWNDDERAVLIARLDAFYAMKYGLDRQDLEFILDPEAVMGKGYPTQTFPQVKANDIRQYGEYRTQRLVLEAWDELHRDGLWKS